MAIIQIKYIVDDKEEQYNVKQSSNYWNDYN